MMRLITGTPGAGKTLFAVSEIIKAVKDGRVVYTNIEGMDFAGVYPLDDTDWRNYPDGSLIVYDEAHQIFRATGRPGLSNDPIINDMDMHRHRGFDLWFITQFPTKVHHEIRSMCDEHYHLLRQFGAKQATVYKWPEAVDAKDQHQRSVADKSLFRYPKDCFKYYKSASVHTAKLRIPAKLKFLFSVIAIIFSIVGYRVYAAGGLASMQAAPSDPVVSAPGWGVGGGAAERPADTTPLSSVVVGGCISSARACQCYTPDLEPIPMQDFECRNLSEQPLAMGLKIGKK
jgi:zona occludens toxin (predicted ATPase)